MRLQAFALLLLCHAGHLLAQSDAFPLESVTIEGSEISKPVVLEIAGLRLTAPINKAGIDEACRKLQESGIFASIGYRYAPGPNQGYALTLTLADQSPMAAASIDVPGVDDQEPWQWLAKKFGRFNRQIPEAETAQKYLAAELERHLGGQLRGQRLTVRILTDLATRAMTLSFQPEVLPRIRAVTFKGNQAVPSAALSSVLEKVLASTEYTGRGFAAAVELNLRPLYEQHGYYRVQFVPSRPEWTDGGVSVTVAITEGETFRLRKVDVVGDELSVDAMLSAAKFPNGELADWKRIQQGIWDLERVLKRRGFLDTIASPERILDDQNRTLDLRLRINKGPLYRFGELRIAGLSADLEGKARRQWKLKAGDALDVGYPNTFMEGFAQTVDLQRFRKAAAAIETGAGDHVIDVKLTFEPR